MKEELTFFERVKSIFLVAVMSVAYFFYAIFVGVYGWIMSWFKNDD
jgi:hypothetical protein